MKTENCSSHVPKPLLTNDKSSFINDRKRLQKRQESALQPSENHQEDDRKPSQGRQKATTRRTGSYHEDEKCLHAAINNKLRDGLHRAALFTFYFSLFVPDRENFSLCTIHFSLPQDSLFTFTSVNCPTSPPSSAAHTVPGRL